LKILKKLRTVTLNSKFTGSDKKCNFIKMQVIISKIKRITPNNKSQEV